MNPLPSFADCVETYAYRFGLVTLTEERQRTINQFLQKSYNNFVVKYGTPTEMTTWKKMRQVVSGEMALEQYLGTPFVKLENNQYGQYTSKGIDENRCGIKVFQLDEFPVIYRQNSRPIVFVMNCNNGSFGICGLGSPQTLNSYRNKDMVPLNEYKRDLKACFYGFDELRQFENINQLRALYGLR